MDTKMWRPSPFESCWKFYKQTSKCPDSIKGFRYKILHFGVYWPWKRSIYDPCKLNNYQILDDKSYSNFSNHIQSIHICMHNETQKFIQALPYILLRSPITRQPNEKCKIKPSTPTQTLFSLASVSAPASKRKRTQSVWPSSAAKISAVRPSPKKYSD